MPLPNDKSLFAFILIHSLTDSSHPHSPIERVHIDRQSTRINKLHFFFLAAVLVM